MYRGRFHYLRRLAQVALVLMVLVGLGYFVNFLNTSEELRIKRVEVFGDLKHLSKEDVVLLSKISPEDRLFSVSFSDIEESLKRHPWVGIVHLRRKFPDIIQVQVQEREVFAALNVGDVYLIDQEGEVFKKAQEGDQLDLPFLTGFSKADLENYPQLMRSYLDRSLSFLQFVNEQEFFKKHEIAEVHFDPVFGFTVFTLNEGLEIFFGREGYVKKQKKLEAFSRSADFEQSSFVRLDLDVKNRVVARKL